MVSRLTHFFFSFLFFAKHTLTHTHTHTHTHSLSYTDKLAPSDLHVLTLECETFSRMIKEFCFSIVKWNGSVVFL